ncbi:hypothetical protein [Burkholderia mayonis]|uniref:hypothetical protein n=1 Tax=Burkholderia mayonis TaxID=1385591 RepID=UPI001939B06E|nr:hypothetical protein [Burkholderia mayonis]
MPYDQKAASGILSVQRLAVPQARRAQAADRSPLATAGSFRFRADHAEREILARRHRFPIRLKPRSPAPAIPPVRSPKPHSEPPERTLFSALQKPPARDISCWLARPNAARGNTPPDSDQSPLSSEHVESIRAAADESLLASRGRRRQSDGDLGPLAAEVSDRQARADRDARLVLRAAHQPRADAGGLPLARQRTAAEALFDDYNYRVFSARIGNVYTAALLNQWVRWAFGVEAPSDEIWEQDGRYYDPFAAEHRAERLCIA